MIQGGEKLCYVKHKNASGKIFSLSWMNNMS